MSNAPQPYAMCAIWLLGTTAPLAFLMSFGLASADGFAIASILEVLSVRRCGVQGEADRECAELVLLHGAAVLPPRV